MAPSTSSKRLDLQGIRALAIVVVLGFHFYPQYVPNGYLGVDQFFVLSGFLMCMLLKRAELQPPCSLISTFYSKRFKRILPLYLLIIFLSIIALYWIFPATAVQTNKESATSALLFVSNRPKTVEEDYFQMLSIAMDIFTHTWSLSVEIQFYFMVPFMFLLGNQLSDRNQYVFYGFLGLASYGFSCFVNPSVAFNSVFARIWQFVVGMLVYLATSTFTSTQNPYKLLQNDEELGLLDENDIEKDENNTKNPWEHVKTFSNPLANTILALIIIIVFWPIGLPAGVVRPLITISTGILMLISDKNGFLSMPGLTYFGDISYSLYLIHWPIYAYWKLSAGNQYELLLALFGSILLAVLFFETFEKWYLRLSSTSVGFLVVLLFLGNVVLINKDGILEHMDNRIMGLERNDNFTAMDGNLDNFTIDDAIRLNTKWSAEDDITCFAPTCSYEIPGGTLGWCRHQGLSPNGKYKLATFGNSWTANHARMFYQECGYKAKSILQGAATGCEPLFPSKNLDRCRNNMTVIADRIEKEKPDYGFIFTRYISIGDPFPSNSTDIKDDPIYRTMLNATLQLVKNIKIRLYILDAIPRVIGFENIVPMLKAKKDLAQIYNITTDSSEPEHFSRARQRHAQLIKDCNGKCALIDYKPTFFDEKTKSYRFFDERGFSYFTFANHLTPHGLEHVRHVWTDVCKSL